MLSEEAMFGADVLSEVRIPGLEHLRNPGGADMTIPNDTDIINHPIDGLARSALTEFVALCRTVHLFWCETVLRQQVQTQFRVIGTAFFDHRAPR